MEAILTTHVWGGFVVWHCAAAFVGLVVLLKLIPALLKRDRREHPYMGARTCGNCSWRGQVGQWNEQCPRCGRSFTA